MKRNYLKIAFVSLFAVATLCSCGKDEDSKNDEEQDYSISIDVEDGASYSETVYTVKAKTSDGSLTFASVSYNGGKFTLNLPGSLNAQSSNDLGEIPESVTVSNRNVNGLHVSLEAYGESDSEITGNLYLVSGDWRGGLMYVDGDVSITGSYTDEAKKHTLKYNMNLRKGWNIVYVKTVLKDDGWIEEEWASTVPNGAAWRVVVDEDCYDCEHGYPNPPNDPDDPNDPNDPN
ncbi:MAG: hypothetical protein LBL13_01915, partial [Bacteroidales bacterium]|nr:hypothetical protein [Bacteroidales bacterium]